MERELRNNPNGFEQERLKLAKKRRESGDHIGALTVYLNLEEDFPKNPEILAEIAATYFDMELFTQSAEYWFRYAASSNSSRVRLRAYSGLSACFCMLGDNRLMGYYAELEYAMNPKEEQEYDKVLTDYYDFVLDSMGNGYYVSYPEKYIPPKRLMFEADNLIDARQDLAAVDRLKNITNDSEYYGESRAKMVQCLLDSGKEKEARELAENTVKEIPEDPFANLTYGLMLIDEENYDEAAKYLVNATIGEFFDEEDYFRLAAALCKIGKEREAFAPLENALDINPYCLHAMFLSGLLKYNFGEKDEARKLFKDVYSITRDTISLFYLKLIEEGDHDVKLDYSFNVTKEETAKRLSRIALVIGGGKAAVKASDEDSLIELFDWSCAFATKLQTEFAVFLIENAGRKVRTHVIKKLTSLTLMNDTKIAVIEALVNAEYTHSVSATFDGVFVKFQILKGDFAKTKALLFKKAFAFAFSRVCPFNYDVYELRNAAYSVQNKLMDNGLIRKVTDSRVLACAIVIKSGFKIRDKLMYEAFFMTDKKSVDKILEMIEEDGETADEEQ